MTSQRTGWRLLVGSSAVVLLFKALGALGGLAFAYFTIQHSGPQSYGVAELFLTVVTIAAVLGRLGLDGAVVRFFASYRSEGRWAAIGEGMRWAAVRVFFATAVLAVILQITRNMWGGAYAIDFHVAMRWFIPVAVMFSLAGFAAEALRGLGKMVPYALLQPGPMLGAATGLLFLTSDAAMALALAAVLWGIIGAVWLALAYTNFPKASEKPPPDKRSDVRAEIWKVARPMWYGGALYLVMSWTDTLMVGYFMTTSDLGVYRFVFRVAALITFSQFAINAIAAPTFGALHARKDYDQMRQSIRRIGWLNTGFATPVFVALLLGSSWIGGFFGEEFATREALSAFAILASAQWVNAMCGPVMYLLNMTDRERMALKILAASAVLNVVLNIWLVPRMGLVGAAWATAIGTVLWNTFAVVYIWRADGLLMNPLLSIFKACRKTRR